MKYLWKIYVVCRVVTSSFSVFRNFESLVFPAKSLVPVLAVLFDPETAASFFLKVSAVPEAGEVSEVLRSAVEVL